MRVLSIGTDELVFEDGGASHQRQFAYAQALGTLDLVVLSKRPHGKEERGPLAITAASSRSRLLRLWRAWLFARASQKPDVVSAQDPFEIGLVALLTARRFRAPLHVQVHTDFLAPGYGRSSPSNRIRLALAGFILRRAAGVRVVSEAIRKGIMKRYRLQVPVNVLPIYVDTARFASARPGAELMRRFGSFGTKLLVVSRLEREKNVSLAVHAFAKAAPADACLIIVGEGRERDELEDCAEMLGVVDRVFFEGRCEPVEYYALADLVLIPSHYEGYGLVIVEALAAGKPVLATDVGVAREAGAIISTPEKYTEALGEWFESGPRTGALRGYPYASFEEYVAAYAGDVAACAERQKSE